MGPVRQNPIQRTARTAHLSALMTCAQLSVHNTARNSSGVGLLRIVTIETDNNVSKYIRASHCPSNIADITVCNMLDTISRRLTATPEF